MDYSLGALKLICTQLKQAKQSPSQTSFTYRGIIFQRAWVQGFLVSVSDRFLLDDATGVVELFLSQDFLCQNNWVPGMYVMVIGAYTARADKDPMIKVHKIVDLSKDPNREAMWYLEVIEAYKLFYKPLFEDFIEE